MKVLGTSFLLKLGLWPWFLTQSSSIPGGWMTGASFALMRWLLVVFRWELVTLQTKPSLEAWNFQPYLLPEEGRWVGDQVTNQSCLCDEASTKVPQLQGSRTFWVDEHIHMLGRRYIPTPHGEKRLHSRTLPDLRLCTPSSSCSSGPFIISFACMCELSHVRLFDTSWTVAHPAPLSMEFSRQEYWSRLPLPIPGDLPYRVIEAASPALVGRVFTPEPPGKPIISFII